MYVLQCEPYGVRNHSDIRMLADYRKVNAIMKQNARWMQEYDVGSNDWENGLCEMDDDDIERDEICSGHNEVHDVTECERWGPNDERWKQSGKSAKAIKCSTTPATTATTRGGRFSLSPPSRRSRARLGASYGCRVI